MVRAMPGLLLAASRQATGHHHWRLDVGAVHRRVPAPDRLGRRRLRALAASNWSAAAPASPAIPELLEALEASGAGTKDLGVEVPKRIAIDRDGRITDERPLRQILTSWDRLQRLLRATIDPAHYHLGWNFERVEQDERGVRVQFSGGRVEHADILVGGDGIRSSVRAQMAPEVQPIYAGYYIWRGAPNEADLAPETLNEHLSAVHVLPAASGSR